MKKTSSKSNDKISEITSKYKCVFNRKDKDIIVGIPSDFDLESDEANLIIDNQVICVDIPDYFIRMHQLSYEKRKMVEKLVNYFINKGKSKVHMGKNFGALLNFIPPVFEIQLTKAIESFYNHVENHFKNKNNEEFTAEFEYIFQYNYYESMLSTAKFQKTTLLLLGGFCANYFISPSFIENGNGIFYYITDDLSKEEEDIFNSKFYDHLIQQQNLKYMDITKKKKDRYSKVKEKFDIDKIYNIEHFLDKPDKDMGFKVRYEKWKIHNMIKYVCFDKFYSDLIEEFLKEK